MNVFQSTYEHRLREWKAIRAAILKMDTAEACIEVDRWWQQAPLIHHHLHPLDVDNWPDPWTMLSDNLYCPLTRAVGICYTLLMGGVTDVKLVQATDEQCEDVNLVLVDCSKYVLNYHPRSVLSTDLNKFKISGALALDPLYKHIK